MGFFNNVSYLHNEINLHSHYIRSPLLICVWYVFVSRFSCVYESQYQLYCLHSHSRSITSPHIWFLRLLVYCSLMIINIHIPQYPSPLHNAPESHMWRIFYINTIIQGSQYNFTYLYQSHKRVETRFSCPSCGMTVALSHFFICTPGA